MDEKKIARFWANVDVQPCIECCWQWRGCKCANGYGRFKSEVGQLAHRFSYALANGPLPYIEGYHGCVVRHLCDNPACCNPHHLAAGTQLDNMRDMIAKGRKRCAMGSAARTSRARYRLTESNVRLIRTNPNGLTDRQFATMFSAHEATIQHARQGRTWRHI